MQTGYPLLVKNNPSDEMDGSHHFLQFKPIFFNERQSDMFENLVHRVTREPGNLYYHLQRIFFCYSEHKSELLYAGLIDLFSVLEGKGQSLSRRLVKGTLSEFSKRQQLALKKYLTTNDLSHVPGNQYTVLDQKLMGTLQLVTAAKTMAPKDCWLLAHDYIEYSQLDLAIEVLEKGVFEQPDQQNIQELLLELYQSTHNSHQFKKMYASVLQRKLNIIAEWKQVNVYFDKQAS